MNPKDVLTSHIKQWLTLEQQMKDLNKKIKELKEQKQVLNDTIIEVMTVNNIDSCKLPDGDTICLKKSIHYASLNKEYIQDTLKTIFGKPLSSNDPEKIANETTESLFNNRESTEKVSLKKMKSK